LQLITTRSHSAKLDGVKIYMLFHAHLINRTSHNYYY